MAEIKGFDKVAAVLKAKAGKVGPTKVVVAVGYTTNYALYVHEAVGMKLKGVPRPKGRGAYWDPQGKAGAKFLEGPARELSSDLAKQIESMIVRGVKLEDALLTAGLRLQRESQQRVPVDTGTLKNSAFTVKES